MAGSVTARKEGANGKIVLRKGGQFAGSVSTKGAEGVPVAKKPAAKKRVAKKPTAKKRGKHSLSPEEREARRKAMHDTFAKAVQDLQTDEGWKQYLDYMKDFHSYSFGNVLLIQMQKPGATKVAGYRQWREKGRFVRKGEKGIAIFGPPVPRKRKKESASGEGGDEKEDEKTGGTFHFTVHVYDITQTDPLPGHEDMTEKNPVKLLQGEDSKGTFTKVATLLTGQGWEVSSEPIAHIGVNGYTEPGTRKVVVNSENSPAQQAKTMIHEWAHIELGHVEDLNEYQQHRGRMEAEAESVAYVMSGILGEDSSGYSVGYVAGWTRNDPETVKEVGEKVLATVNRMCATLGVDG